MQVWGPSIVPITHFEFLFLSETLHLNLHSKFLHLITLHSVSFFTPDNQDNFLYAVVEWQEHIFPCFQTPFPSLIPHHLGLVCSSQK